MDITSQINEMGQLINTTSETVDPISVQSVSSNVLGSSFDGITSAFSSIANFFSKIDWTPFHWLLIALAVFLPIWIIWLFLSGRVSFYGFNFGEDFGLKLITGRMGASKTRNTFLMAYFWKKDNPNGILISNIPYDFTDLFFNSKKDFNFLLRDLTKYMIDHNYLDALKEGSDFFPPILLICDEAHYYLFARDFTKNLNKDTLLTLTQCRKRNILIDFITQELGQLDVFPRRLCPYIIHYQKEIDTKKFGPLLYKQSLYYVSDPETTSMVSVIENNDPLAYSYILGNSIVNLFKNKEVGPYLAQQYLTRFVIGSTNEYINQDDLDNYDSAICSHRYEEFLSLVNLKRENIKKAKIKAQSDKKRILKFNPFDQSVNEQIIEEQKKVIENLLSMIPEDELDRVKQDIMEIEQGIKKD